jgi:hypothetical protein
VIVSRSQLLLATHLMNAEIANKQLVKGGKPTPDIVSREWLSKPAPDGDLIVENLDQAQLPNGKLLSSLPDGSSGSYLLLLEQTGPQRYRIVGATGGPGSNSGPICLIYPWSSAVERQIHR